MLAVLRLLAADVVALNKGFTWFVIVDLPISVFTSGFQLFSRLQETGQDNWRPFSSSFCIGHPLAASNPLLSCFGPSWQFPTPYSQSLLTLSIAVYLRAHFASFSNRSPRTYWHRHRPPMEFSLCDKQRWWVYTPCSSQNDIFVFIPLCFPRLCTNFHLATRNSDAILNRAIEHACWTVSVTTAIIIVNWPLTPDQVIIM